MTTASMFNSYYIHSDDMFYHIICDKISRYFTKNGANVSIYFNTLIVYLHLVVCNFVQNCVNELTA